MTARGQGIVAAAQPPIVAIATARGPAAIGILRLSGAGSLEMCRGRLVGLPAELPPRRLHRARLQDSHGEPLDDVLVAHFPGPRSYTGEEVVEIHCHGGTALLEAALGCLCEAGARHAEPGEFTRRAVRHGRMDLLEAEALAALLEAEEAEGLELARRASGEVGPAIRTLRSRTLAVLAEAQGAHDHPLETVGEALGWREACQALAEEARRLAGHATLERRDREGHRVVLLGPPNAGKSSLLNALIGEPRALVDEAPGTTRDPVLALLRLGGRRAAVYDTAGLRPAVGVEAAGVARALEVAAAADLVLWVEDVAAAPAAPPGELAIDLRVLAKADLAPHPDRPKGDAVRVSSTQGWGVAELRGRLVSLLRPRPAAVSERQRRLLERAATDLAEAGAGTAAAEDLAVAAAERALGSLDQLCGVGAGWQEAEAQIFQRFCLGK